MKTITLAFQASDFDGNSYDSNDDCALARLAKRQFGDTYRIRVGGTYVHLKKDFITMHELEIGQSFLNGQIANIGDSGFDIFAYTKMSTAFKNDPDTLASVELTYIF